MRPRRALFLVLLLWMTALVVRQLTACELRTANAEEQRPAINDPPPTKDHPSPTKLKRRTLLDKRTPDPYEGWPSWCEAQQLPPCQVEADCHDVFHPSGRALKCIRPWYAEPSSSLRVCSPGFSNRSERDHQRARIRELVRLQYSGEAEACGDGMRCRSATARGDRLAALLNAVAQRETTMRHWKRHRLNGDVRASRRAWHRTAELYGHERDDKAITFTTIGNRHFRQRERWEYGLGLYGMNAALFTKNWSQIAPPEILCREVEGTEAYLRAARRGWKKIAGGIDCDGQPGREWFGVAGQPTWYDVHHYASGGKLCPSKPGMAKFEKVAKKIGIPPFAAVSLRDLGEPIEAEKQNVTALLLLGQLEVFSTQWFASRG